MDILTFLSEIIKTVIWPLVILCVILILKKPLRVLLLSLRRIQYGAFSVEFGRQVYDLAKKFMRAMPEAGEIKFIEIYPASNRTSDIIGDVMKKTILNLENAAGDSISIKGSDKTQLELYNKLMELGRMAIQCPEPAPDPNAVEVYLWMVRRMTELLRSF
jgi:hypothetical protein